MEFLLIKILFERWVETVQLLLALALTFPTKFESNFIRKNNVIWKIIFAYLNKFTKFGQNHHLIKFILIKLISILLLTNWFIFDFLFQPKNRILVFVHILIDYGRRGCASLIESFHNINFFYKWKHFEDFKLNFVFLF